MECEVLLLRRVFLEPGLPWELPGEGMSPGPPRPCVEEACQIDWMEDFLAADSP